jgi:hypothetical protein
MVHSPRLIPVRTWNLSREWPSMHRKGLFIFQPRVALQALQHDLCFLKRPRPFYAIVRHQFLVSPVAPHLVSAAPPVHPHPKPQPAFYTFSTRGADFTCMSSLHGKNICENHSDILATPLGVQVVSENLPIHTMVAMCHPGTPNPFLPWVEVAPPLFMKANSPPPSSLRDPSKFPTKFPIYLI